MTLADTQAIAIATGRKPATIRSWAHRGLIQRRGRNHHGRALYDLAEAITLDGKIRTVQHSDRSRTTAPRRS